MNVSASLVAQDSEESAGNAGDLDAEDLGRVPSLGWEEPLEKGRAALSSILAWRIPWAEEPGQLQSMGLQRVRHD